MSGPEKVSADPTRRPMVMQVADEHGCPRCGVLVGGKPYDVRESRIKDLPVGHRPPQVVLRKLRHRCPESVSAQRMFTERSVQMPPRYVSPGGCGIGCSGRRHARARAQSDVAGEYRGSWWSVQRGLVVEVVRLTAPRAGSPPSLIRMLGLDETRARLVRWVFDDEQRWRLSTRG